MHKDDLCKAVCPKVICWQNQFNLINNKMATKYIGNSIVAFLLSISTYGIEAFAQVEERNVRYKYVLCTDPKTGKTGVYKSTCSDKYINGVSQGTTCESIINVCGNGTKLTGLLPSQIGPDGTIIGSVSNPVSPPVPRGPTTEENDPNDSTPLNSNSVKSGTIIDAPNSSRGGSILTLDKTENARWKGMTGVMFQSDFKIYNSKDASCRLIIYFYVNSTQLGAKDKFDDEFDNLTTADSFKPSSNGAAFSKFRLFISYSAIEEAVRKIGYQTPVTISYYASLQNLTEHGEVVRTETYKLTLR
ncbi:hypothetical protein SAMN06265337_0634 [Hymenobacter gelipurpurascens]|uniref:Uncharacterized protein n=1 Tax=Hymenobacter gelipurpurascens TaxID=89968 RepID=A0A212T872_9BACT|nr:hypothetical protein [Hymenobacter gelipurpurascens]SNC62257.1 hypothetical protein SAMN06265337_0634 [Hymenobacter gelipurpurascens]